MADRQTTLSGGGIASIQVAVVRDIDDHNGAITTLSRTDVGIMWTFHFEQEQSTWLTFFIDADTANAVGRLFVLLTSTCPAFVICGA
ncbi:MAG: hypothetical protein P8K08_14985 [Fuerstiella sp.]|jgi:hypothetical protein|nr:hypothetical protein [Fuerstiella sp.]